MLAIRTRTSFPCGFLKAVHGSHLYSTKPLILKQTSLLPGALEPPPGFFVKRAASGNKKADLDFEDAPPFDDSPALDDDLPAGFGPGKASHMAAFYRQCEWYYVDPSGQEHGPEPTSKVVHWYKRGHFHDGIKASTLSLHSWVTAPP